MSEYCQVHRKDKVIGPRAPVHFDSWPGGLYHFADARFADNFPTLVLLNFGLAKFSFELKVSLCREFRWTDVSVF